MIDPSFPFIDLHRHLDGSLRLETILELAQQHNLPLPAYDLAGLTPFVQVLEPQPGVMEFIAKMHWMVGVLADTEACRRVAYENVIDLAGEMIDYAELRFSPFFMAESHQLDPLGVVEAVVDGVETAARDSGQMVRLIGILSRTYGPEMAMKELETLLAFSDHLVGIDLAGDEARHPGDEFVEHMRRAREKGLLVTVHAGESVGAESVWQAIGDLGAVRIGHAVHALEDPALIDALRERHIGIEANLTSNVQTSTVEDYAHHPLKQFLESGLLATINTDDPGVSAITLPYEYQVAAPAAGLSPEQIYQAQRNALEIAFLSTQGKTQLLEKKQNQ